MVNPRPEPNRFNRSLYSIIFSFNSWVSSCRKSLPKVSSFVSIFSKHFSSLLSFFSSGFPSSSSFCFSSVAFNSIDCLLSSLLLSPIASGLTDLFSSSSSLSGTSSLSSASKSSLLFSLLSASISL